MAGFSHNATITPHYVCSGTPHYGGWCSDTPCSLIRKFSIDKLDCTRSFEAQRRRQLINCPRQPVNMLPQDSPFLDPGPKTRPNTLAIVQLSKDDLVPVYLRDTQGEHDGYKEGHVLNTRFGSFPHSTLIGIPWGSQVRASNVDTGSRGRRKNKQKAALVAASTSTDLGTDGAEDGGAGSGGLKRKREIADEGEKRAKDQPIRQSTSAHGQDSDAEIYYEADGSLVNDIEVENEDGSPAASTHQGSNNTSDQQRKTKTTTAKSGFVHILPPTPEIWTSSLPHRTQVVYTPDYSYILQRIRARPGSRLIESGSGSGSFTHAAARAVYNGQPEHHNHPSTTGKVFSFEFHEQRFEKLKREIGEHGLEGLVEINHRDVYNDGFLVDGKSPEADAIFLDLPAPWLALPHLSRRKPKTGTEMKGVQSSSSTQDDWVSPLNPHRSAYICTFSPCIEQVTRTVSEMRKLGWVEIEMFEIAHKRVQVYREKMGLDIVSERGMQQAPKDVAEAVAKLKEIEVKAAEHNAKMLAATKGQKKNSNDNNDDDDDVDEDVKPNSKSARDNTVQVVEEDKNSNSSSAKLFMQGQLVTRPETEIKAHTSYLVFAILPREWTEEDEAAAAAKWPIGKEQKVIGAMDRAARKQQKREQLHQKSKKGQKEKRPSQQQQQQQQGGQQPAKPATDNNNIKEETTTKSEDAVMEDAQEEKA